MHTVRTFTVALLSFALFAVPDTAALAQSVAVAEPETAFAQNHPTIVRQSEGTFDAARRAQRADRQTELAWYSNTRGVMPASPDNMQDGFASSGFAQFMSSKAGRIVRVVAGIGMIAGGIAADTDLGTGIAIAGAVPLLAGTFDFCVLSALFGGPLSGQAIREAGK